LLSCHFFPLDQKDEEKDTEQEIFNGQNRKKRNKTKHKRKRTVTPSHPRHREYADPNQVHRSLGCQSRARFPRYHQ
jgi:hypothetical protein